MSKISRVSENYLEEREIFTSESSDKNIMYTSPSEKEEDKKEYVNLMKK